MEQIVVKSEVQNNGEILLYYVDENGDSQEGVLTTIENTDNDATAIQESSSFIFGNYGDLDEDDNMEASVEEPDSWTDDDLKRLLTFFNDNKNSFVSGITQKRHLWAVACKTMLLGKNQEICEEKLNELKQKYCEVRGFIKSGVYVKWPFLEMCHQAFHDDPFVVSALSDEITPPDTEPKIVSVKQVNVTQKDGILSIKQVNMKPPDVNVEKLLNVYLKYKENFQKEHWRRDLWDKIAEEMGEEDSDYLQKRFLNHKQHYINMLIKKKETNDIITWPYMDLFDKIFGDDVNFHKKHFNTDITPEVDYTVPEHEWNDVQLIVLAKYCYDCHDEFQDRTIPNKFLWTEVGRLIEKKPESCEIKYELLLREHLEKFIAGDYSLPDRKAIAIVFDYTIVKNVQADFNKSDSRERTTEVSWKSSEIDELVQFFYDKIELFKDPEIHFVCFAAVAQKLKKSVKSCIKQWDDLVVLYKSILQNKKENSDLQIDWRYIELFDRIFDYGMDSNLLKGYMFRHQPQKEVGKVTVKKVHIKNDPNDEYDNDPNAYKEDHDPTEPRTDPRSSKILEYYLRNKDKFSARNKLTTWDPLAKQIGLSSSQCAHRFKTLKQTYIDYVKKELDKPRLRITWPYYALCKKVFGYRIIRAKLKQGLMDTDNNDDWLAREIKLLISYFSQHFHDITNNIEDVTKWDQLAVKLGKSQIGCKEKFVELRKCYRKLKTMRKRKPDVKISWSYFDMFDRIYSIREEECMEVEMLDEHDFHMEGVGDGYVLEEGGEEAGEEAGEEEYQCIIVLQEGQELPTDIGDAQIIVQQNSDGTNTEFIANNIQLEDNTLTEPISNTTENGPKTKWTKRAKKLLLVHYLNYIRLQRGKEIKPREMWADIAAKFTNKKPINCRRMFHKIKDNYMQADEAENNNNPFASLLSKVVKLKPKFVKSDHNKQQGKVYKDVPMDSGKVNLALAYYLEHIEEFVNPRFEKKYLWTQLANHIYESVTKIYNKINYLKQAYNIETEEIDGEVTEFSALLKEIISKEVAVSMVLDIKPSPEFNSDDASWSDDEIQQLLLWYLSNLDKFKNPKFNRSYLWMEASAILNKSPLVCSKKMTEIRTLYKTMVKENAEELQGWIFYELCQKIYGTGKKNNPVVDN